MQVYPRGRHREMQKKKKEDERTTNRFNTNSELTQYRERARAWVLYQNALLEQLFLQAHYFCHSTWSWAVVSLSVHLTEIPDT